MALDIDIRKVRDASRPVLLEDGTVEIHSIDFSSADQWLRCGEQYRFRHIEGLKSPPDVALTEGSSHHAALEADNAEKWQRSKQLKAGQLTELFEADFDLRVKAAEEECENLKLKLDWDGENRGMVMGRAKKLHLDYASKHSKRIKPDREPEFRFSREVEVDGIRFRLFGSVDVATKEQVIDYKTTSRLKTEKDVRESLQLAVYAWALEKQEASLVSLIKSADPHVEWATLPKSLGEQAWALKVVAGAVKAIRAGQFPLTKPDPMNWICSPRFCGFWGRCRGAVQGGKR